MRRKYAEKPSPAPSDMVLTKYRIIKESLEIFALNIQWNTGCGFYYRIFNNMQDVLEILKEESKLQRAGRPGLAPEQSSQT